MATATILGKVASSKTRTSILCGAQNDNYRGAQNDNYRGAQNDNYRSAQGDSFSDTGRTRWAKNGALNCPQSK